MSAVGDAGGSGYFVRVKSNRTSETQHRAPGSPRREAVGGVRQPSGGEGDSLASRGEETGASQGGWGHPVLTPPPLCPQQLKSVSVVESGTEELGLLSPPAAETSPSGAVRRESTRLLEATPPAGSPLSPRDLPEPPRVTSEHTNNRIGESADSGGGPCVLRAEGAGGAGHWTLGPRQEPETWGQEGLVRKTGGFPCPPLEAGTTFHERLKACSGSAAQFNFL